jgi:hypothetical protein
LALISETPATRKPRCTHPSERGFLHPSNGRNAWRAIRFPKGIVPPDANPLILLSPGAPRGSAEMSHILDGALSWREPIASHLRSALTYAAVCASDVPHDSPISGEKGNRGSARHHFVLSECSGRLNLGFCAVLAQSVSVGEVVLGNTSQKGSQT